MALDLPRADIKSSNGQTTVVTANSGVYQSNTQFIDLFGDVTMTRENGTQIVTASARLDTANNAAEGHDPVVGHGPSGNIKAQGFQFIDQGDIVIFTGATDLWLRGGNSGSATAPQPATVPQPVAQAAAQIEAAVTPTPPRPAPAAARPAPRPTPHPAAKAAVVPSKPAAKKPG